MEEYPQNTYAELAFATHSLEMKVAIPVIFLTLLC